MTNLTVGDLRRAISELPDDTKLIFDGGMTFNRLKRWADDEFIVCFNEIHAELSPVFKKKHPEIIVAYCRTEALNENEPAGITYVPRL